MKHYDSDDDGADSVFGDLNQLQSMTSQLDERGLVLALAAFAEDALGSLIGGYLIDSDQAKQLLEGFNAPLGTFSARIKMAYALGLVTESQHGDLDRLRKIRNAFAHEWRGVSLTDQKIASHVAALSFSSLDEAYPETPWDKVRSSIGALLVEIRSVTHQNKLHGRRATSKGQHLIAGLTGDLDEQLNLCATKLLEIVQALATADGDRQRFLQASYSRWVGKLGIAKGGLPPSRRQNVESRFAAIHQLYERAEGDSSVVRSK